MSVLDGVSLPGKLILLVVLFVVAVRIAWKVRAKRRVASGPDEIEQALARGRRKIDQHRPHEPRARNDHVDTTRGTRPTGDTT